MFPIEVPLVLNKVSIWNEELVWDNFLQNNKVSFGKRGFLLKFPMKASLEWNEVSIWNEELVSENFL